MVFNDSGDKSDQLQGVLKKPVLVSIANFPPIVGESLFITCMEFVKALKKKMWLLKLIGVTHRTIASRRLRCWTSNVSH